MNNCDNFAVECNRLIVPTSSLQHIEYKYSWKEVEKQKQLLLKIKKRKIWVLHFIERLTFASRLVEPASLSFTNPFIFSHRFSWNLSQCYLNYDHWCPMSFWRQISISWWSQIPNCVLVPNLNIVCCINEHVPLEYASAVYKWIQFSTKLRLR